MEEELCNGLSDLQGPHFGGRLDGTEGRNRPPVMESIENRERIIAT